MRMVYPVMGAFLAGVLLMGRSSGKSPVREAKNLRENLSESQVDKMVRDSFPASDPPSTY